MIMVMIIIGCHLNNHACVEKFQQQEFDVEKKRWISGQRVNRLKRNNG